MGQYIITVKNRDYRIDVKKIEGKRADIEIDGKAITVYIKQLGVKEEAPRRTPVKKRVEFAETQSHKTPTTADPSGKTVPIKAPIPGVILKVHVKEGDEIKAGQDILIMEAMKMENQIQATRSGKISKIHVKQDDSVMQDEILVEIEPA